MIRDLYRTLAEASEKKPKSKAKDAAKKPIPKEEPAYVVKLVDGKKTRDTIAVDFIGGGHELAYPGIIPKGEIWIEQDLSPDEQVDILVHELIELALMRRGHEYAPSHKLANELEKVFRGFEGRWKTKQAPSGDKKVEEALVTETYSGALTAFIKYLNGGVDPYDFSHMLAEFFEDEGIDPPESFDESEPYEYLDTPDFNEHKEQFVGWLGKKLSEDMSGADAYAPTYLFMSGAKLVPRQTWLIHFSDDAGDIAENGFEFGSADFTALGLTTHLTDNKRRQGPGWNFAFKADDRDVRNASEKYGEEAVLFQSAGAEAYHNGDNEDQVVFWGPNVKERYYLQQRDGDWVVMDPTTDKELIRNQNIFNVIAWVKQNHGQYKKIITNNRKAVPIQPTPVADREKLQAQKPEHTPQPFESVSEANSNHTFTAYHGTARQFAVFKLSTEGQFGPGIYLASTFDDGKEFGWNSQAANEEGNKTEPIQVLKVKVSFKNPVYGKGDGIIDEVTNITGETLWPKINAKLQKLGHDGLIISFPDGKREYVAFDPSQVKILDRTIVKEAEATPGTCPKCGLAKHRSIPHLCAKGRSKWGMKGGKFTTPERKLYKIAEGETDLLTIVKNTASNEHPDDHLPEDYAWAREKAFNPMSMVHMMPGGIAGWRSWFETECESEPEHYASLAKAEKIDNPVVVSPGHIWDGWHRIAAAIVNGIKTIPAIVGKHRAR